MKIMYLISSIGHGQGGQFYSLRDLIKTFDRNEVEPVIVVVGDGKATRVFDNLECQKFFLLMRRANEMEAVLQKLESIVQVERPDVLHSCSNTALFSAMYLSRIYRLPLIHTQPYGLKPDFFPRLPYLIAYSKEGEEYFSGDPKYRGMEIFCFPNRVAKVVPDASRIKKLKKELNFPPGFVFLRIARICEMYKESFLKSVALVEKLNKDGIKSNLLIIGVNEQPWIYEELKKYESPSVRVVVDDEYFHDADDLMEIADGVIGAGNSLMAAASLGKILLTTPSFTRYPILVNDGNFQQLFKYNFRCTAPASSRFDIDEDKNYEMLKELLIDRNKREKYRVFSFNLFENYFDVSRRKEEYVNLYKRLVYKDLASLREYYWRLLDTLTAASYRLMDKIGVRRLKFISLKIILRMLFRRRRQPDKIIELAAGQNLEVREFRLTKKRYDLVVLAQGYNEEKFINRFLSEAGAVANGIVFLDDGSTDRTNELAVHEKILLKLRRRRNEGFDDLGNRNLLLSFAELIPAHWFLFLDIDEIVDERSRPELANIVKRSDIDIVEVGIVNLWDNEEQVRIDLPPPSVNGVLWRPRLFRKKERMRIISPQPLHFQLLPYQTDRLSRGRIMIRHYANINKERRMMRYERYCREDSHHLSQRSYEHLIAEKAVLKPIETVYEEIDSLGIQLHINELQEIAGAIKPPLNFLVFGLGNDSAFWFETNKGGRTVFIEDDEKFFERIKAKYPFLEAYLVNYNTKLTNWRDLINQPEKLYLDLPESVKKTQWDVILVDGPAGWFDEAPGRMKSIYTAARLVRSGGDVFVHDGEREVESAYCDKFLLPTNLISVVKGRAELRHYRINQPRQ